jgi:hypothetical protein
MGHKVKKGQHNVSNNKTTSFTCHGREKQEHCCTICILQHVVGWFMLFNTTFNNNIMEVSFIGGGKRSTVPENHRPVT